MEDIIWKVSSLDSTGQVLPPLLGEEPIRVLSELTISVFVSVTTTGISYLFIEGSISSNHTKVQCTIQRDGGFTFDNSPPATLRVFGNSVRFILLPCN